MVVVQGTETASLEKGPGHYKNTSLPGQPGTVAIAGHRTTYLAPFRHIDEIRNGDEIRLENALFRLHLHRPETRGGRPERRRDPEAGRLSQLVLTACHPPYSAHNRYAIFAKLNPRRPTRAGHHR